MEIERIKWRDEKLCTIMNQSGKNDIKMENRYETPKINKHLIKNSI